MMVVVVDKLAGVDDLDGHRGRGRCGKRGSGRVVAPLLDIVGIVIVIVVVTVVVVVVDIGIDLDDHPPPAGSAEGLLISSAAPVVDAAAPCGVVPPLFRRRTGTGIAGTSTASILPVFGRLAGPTAIVDVIQVRLQTLAAGAPDGAVAVVGTC